MSNPEAKKYYNPNSVGRVVGRTIPLLAIMYGIAVAAQFIGGIADNNTFNDAKRIQDTIKANPEGYKIVPLSHKTKLVVFDKEAEDIEGMMSKALDEMTSDGRHYVHKVVETSSETTSSRIAYLIPR